MEVGKLIFLLSLIFVLSPYALTGHALILGVLVALTIGNPYLEQTKKLSKPLLQVSIVLLGFGINFQSLISSGREGLIISAITIFGTFLTGLILGKLLRLSPMISILISVGTAICGGSAIAAAATALNSKSEDISISIAVVFLLNSLALYLFPFLGHLLSLTPEQFGIWAGIAIHDVSSVVGAASQFSDPALQIATTVKLSRTLWIAPLVVTLTFITNRFYPELDTSSNKANRSFKIPLFIIFFFLASLITTNYSIVAEYSTLLIQLGKKGLTLTLFLIGAGVSKKSFESMGITPIVHGFILWLLISILSLLFIL